MRTSRVLAALTASAVLSVGLVACSGDAAEDEADGSPTPSTPAASDPADDGSPTDAPEVGAEVAPFLARVRNGFGERGSVHFTVATTGPATIAFEGDTSYGPDGNATRLVTTAPDGKMQLTVIGVGGDVYVSAPGIVPKGKYFRMPADNPAFAGYDPSGLSPVDAFASIEAGVYAVTAKGTDEVGGVTTDRFELTLDAERAMAALAEDGGGAVAGMPETLVYEVWLDEEDQLRRVRYEAGDPQDPAEVTMEMTRWGEAEPVVAPDEADLVDTPRIFDPE